MRSVIPQPDGWRLTTIGALATHGSDAVVGGPFGSSLTTKDYVPTGVPVIRGSNLSGEECQFIDDDFVYVSDEKAIELSRNTAEPGDVIFTQRGTLGQVAIIPADARFSTYIVSQSQMRVRVDEEAVLPRFLYWQYRGPFARRYLESRTLATGVPHINLGILKDFPAALPPLPEQRRIAAILDEADALRRTRREALGLLDELLRSTFLEMFGDPVTNPRGWPTVDLSTLLLDGPTNGLYRPSSDYGSGTPIVRIDSFYDGAITDLSKLKRVAIEPSVVERYALTAGQVLINRVNSPEHLGKAALVPDLNEATVFESNMMRLTLDKEKVVPTFLVTQLLSPYLRRQIANSAKDAVNQSSINQHDVRSFKTRLPPLPLQHRWAAFVAAHWDQLAARHRQGDEADHLFASLLHRAFAGELGSHHAT